eukprot:m.191004 g.191004  ORF g.191004 m.191004 type:complete len:149 (+) comp18581_c0_seq4:237-683(+)
MLIEHSKDAYALMPEPDQSVWRLFTNQKKNSASSLVKEFDIDDDDVTSSSGSTVVRKPSLPSDAVLSRADSIIASLPPLPNTASMPKRASAGAAGCFSVYLLSPYPLWERMLRALWSQSLCCSHADEMLLEERTLVVPTWLLLRDCST